LLDVESMVTDAVPLGKTEGVIRFFRDRVDDPIKVRITP
jgi:hypothetical protein